MNGRNYLIPIGARIPSQAFVRVAAVDLDWVNAAITDARNRLNIIVLDACRDNPLPKGVRSGSKGLAVTPAPKGTIIAYATSPGSTAADGSGSNGLYTSQLLKYMQAKGLKVEEVFKRVRQGVDQASGGKQIPWEHSSIVGDFYFKPDKGQQPVELAGAPGTTPEVKQPLPPPAPPTTPSTDDLTALKEKAKQKASWSTWQGRMNSYWKEVEGLESSQLSAKEKVTAWRGALAKFTDDNPFSTDDETLRSHAKERVSYWEGKAKEGDRAAKAAKARRKQKKATSAIERLSDGRFIKNTNGVVTDNRTGLQWYVGPGKGTNWYEAKRWVEALNIAGGSWRMPSMDELKGLYQQGNSIQNLGPIFGTSTRWVWSGNTRPPSDAWSFNTKYGLSLWTSCDNRDNMSFAVRSFSQKASLSKNQSTLTEHLTNSIGMQFVLIPAGNFIMGSKSNPEEIASRLWWEDK